MKRFFHSELEEFRQQLVLMGEKANELVRLALRALREREITLAEEVLALDDEIDELEMQIDAEAIRYLSLRSPVATELRLLTVGMKVGHDLERVGDEACSIAKRTRELIHNLPLIDVSLILQMGEPVLALLRDAVDAFLDQDVEKARSIPGRDAEIDQINRENFKVLSEVMRTSPESLENQLRLIFISKSLERVADHATNLAEEVVLLYGGEDLRHSAETRRSPEAESEDRSDPDTLLTPR